MKLILQEKVAFKLVCFFGEIHHASDIAKKRC